MSTKQKKILPSPEASQVVHLRIQQLKIEVVHVQTRKKFIPHSRISIQKQQQQQQSL
jgi:hypothetical protein